MVVFFSKNEQILKKYQNNLHAPLHTGSGTNYCVSQNIPKVRIVAIGGSTVTRERYHWM